jgi:hypothetical protein
MKPGAQSYIVRKADEELYRLLLSGEFCYILTTRQMGKSSLMARTAERLSQEGVLSVQVDLTMIGGEKTSITPSQWYYGVAHAILRGLKIREDLPTWWHQRELLPPGQRFTEFLEDLVLKRLTPRIVIFIDEIDFTIEMKFCDDFFAGIRAAYNARAMKPEFARLTFVLLGVATPPQLINDPTRTPFNIGQGIELTDFLPSECEILASGLSGDVIRSRELLQRILHWTRGYPYLTQALCKSVAQVEGQLDEQGAQDTPTELVDRLVDNKFLSAQAVREEMNLKFVGALLRKAHPDRMKVLAVYRDVVLGRAVRDEPTNAVHAALKLSGVVKPDQGGMLRVRNLIYERVFDQQWIREEMPPDAGAQEGSRSSVAELGKHLPQFVELTTHAPPYLLQASPRWFPGSWALPSVMLTGASISVLLASLAYVFRSPVHGFRLPIPPEGQFPFDSFYLVIPFLGSALAWYIVIKCAYRPGPNLPRYWALVLAVICSGVAIYGVADHFVTGNRQASASVHGMSAATFLSVMTLSLRLKRVFPYDRLALYIAPLALTIIMLVCVVVIWWAGR